MEKYGIDKKNVEIVNEKIVISSEELANAIQNGEVNLNDDEEAGFNIICLIASKQ